MSPAKVLALYVGVFALTVAGMYVYELLRRHDD